MSRRALRTLGLLLGLALASAAAAAPSVILISLDGTRADLLERLGPDRLPALHALAEAGGRGRLVPVFPSNTFPNHVTLVTGVGPERHGVVANVFRDPERGLHRYEDDPTWSEAEPLWSILARHGLPSAAYHWVGSEGPWRSGLGPRHWHPFDESVPESRKVEQILAWLDLSDPSERPRLVTAWFRGADHAGHRHGPDARRAAKALVAQDQALGRLVAGIAARELWHETTLLVVSDHGMLPVERTVDLRGALEGARVLGGGGFAIVEAPGATPEQLEGLAATARALGLEAWPRTKAPPELPVDHPRFGDVVVVAPPGTAILKTRFRRPGGVHGQPPGPDRPGLEALFLARGRGVPPGSPLGRACALDVAPSVLALLGLPVPGTMEGRILEALVLETRRTRP